MSKGLLSVYDVVHYLKQSLDCDGNLQSIMVKGEISNFTNHRSGHWYFTLKDARAKISCVMFASYASRCKIRLKEGMQVIVQASLSLYEASGNLQLYVSHVQVDGLGNLYLQLEEVKKKMASEGLFDPARKKPLPLYPMNIGVVTAKTGAAVQDILTTISRRWPLAKVKVYPTLVQGVNASKAIMQSLQIADEQQHDIILLARGGGAIEDLWCFNDESLARFIVGMKTVIVSGVGHETDTTLVDYVSDARAATPTAAAEFITPDIVDVKANVDAMKHRMETIMINRLNQYRNRVDFCRSHRYIKNPFSYIEHRQMELAMHVKMLSSFENKLHRKASQLQSLTQQLATNANKTSALRQNKIDALQLQLQYKMQEYRQGKQNQLQQSISLLDAYSPLKILQRGYTIASLHDHVLHSIDEVNENDVLSLRMQDGYIETKVLKKEKL